MPFFREKGLHPSWARSCLIGLLAALTATPGRASGWDPGERGAKAASLARAFVAQADDPSAVFYNPGGLAFVEDRGFAAGFRVAAASSARFDALDTGAARGRRIDPEPRGYLYWVEPVASRWALGMALHGSAGFEFEWKVADSWAGRFESRYSRLSNWDLSATAAVRAHPRLGLATGIVVRSTTLRWERHETAPDPATMSAVEIGRSSLHPDRVLGLGPVLGVLYRPDGRWTVGLRWQGEIRATLEGRAAFRQIFSGDPAFDALAAGLLPFGEDSGWSARLRHPGEFVVGVAYAPVPTALLEIDLEHRGWSSLRGTTVRIDGRPDLDRRLFEGWKSRVSTRIGLRWNGLGNGEWRAGIHRDPTPQPASGLGAFYMGSDRYGASIGFGTRVERLQTDVALVWEEHRDRHGASTAGGGRYSSRFLHLVLGFGW